MKELSEKAKRYDEALKKAKDFYKGYKQRDNQLYADDLESLFPELKESEDERIRKALKEYFINSFQNNGVAAICGVHIKDILVWLEKQGEQNLANSAKTCKAEPKFKVGDKIYLKQEYRMPDDDTPIANTVFEIRAIDDKHYKFDGSYIFIEDQDKYELVEQKPTDKVEPKFKVGDWITNGDYTWKIVEVKPLDYILQSQDGNIVDDTISHVDEQFHSFTIEDAKDGDVLASKYSNDILIFKNLEGSKSFSSYYNIRRKVENGWSIESFIPATKEQCDTLEKAITKAGYRWDKEKLKLEKI